MSLNPLLRCLGGILFVASCSLEAREYRFSPSSLEGDMLNEQEIDLSLFSKSNAQLPGTYASKVTINARPRADAKISYVSAPDGSLIAQLTPDMLRAWGINVDRYPSLLALAPNETLPEPLGYYIPLAFAQLDFSTMTLALSLPQAAVGEASPDYIDPSRWDDGVPVLFSDYTFSGSEDQDDGSDRTANRYLNMRTGANLLGWRLRNYSTWSQSDTDNQWENLSTYVQHDVDALKAQFTAGESSTRGEVFDSVQYRGVNLASDEEMLPYSQRGFAPVIRGIASSNAEVSVRQNGYLIYQQNVAPGAFEIDDLYSTTNSGDLEVTVKEADGTEHRFTQPYSSIAVMQRPGHIKFEMTAGRYRADSASSQKEPEFLQGSAIYGFNNFMTWFGGLTISEDYNAANTGAGMSLGPIGSLSADVTLARTRLDDESEHTGHSLRLLYTGKIDATDTNLTLGSYRYSSRGYYSFADANQKMDENEDDLLFRYNKRSRLQASVSQTVSGVSLYLNGYQQDYWGTSKKERSLSAGFNTVISGVSYHMAYSYSKADGEATDRMVSFGFSVPLSKWLPRAWSSYNISNSQHGYTRQNLGLSGTLLDDQRLSYSLQQSHANHDGDDTSSVYGSYRSQYANLNAGYYASANGSKQLNYGISGGIVAHPQGVTLSQPLGSQFAIVTANDASGVRFQNQRGVQTDWLGNAVIPSLTPYQENTIRIDTASLPEDVDSSDTSATVIPSRNAAVVARFNAHVGYRMLIALQRPDGQRVPFGAIACCDAPAMSGIVDDTGTVYFAGIGESALLNVKWGNAPDQQCSALITPQTKRQNASPNGIYSVSALCQQESSHDK